ncbi:MAG: amino acid kinase family protein [Candidatus Helarchaeota archaeon]
MDAVIKIGGSLISEPDILRPLLNEITSLIHDFTLLLIPGGGALADQVRLLDRQYELSSQAAHHMALLAEDINAFLIQDLMENAIVIDRLDDESINSDVPIILQPAREVMTSKILPSSWDVTSDSVAAWIAKKVKANHLILVKDVDGLFEHDPKTHANPSFVLEITISDLEKWEGPSCVDKWLPKILTVPCHVVNGKNPERIRTILLKEPTRETLILPRKTKT